MTQGLEDRPEDDTPEGITPQPDIAGSYMTVSHPDERNWSTLLHLSALTGLITSGLGNIVAPLAVWLILRARSDMIDEHGKQALNFQISFFIYAVVSIVLMIALIGFILFPIVFVMWLVWTILAGIRANRGDPPGYILAIRFIK